LQRIAELDGASLDEPLCERIRRQIREHTSPHHVPRKILAVADLQRAKAAP